MIFSIYIIPQNYAKVKRNQKIIALLLYNFYKTFEESEGRKQSISLRVPPPERRMASDRHGRYIYYAKQYKRRSKAVRARETVMTRDSTRASG